MSKQRRVTAAGPLVQIAEWTRAMPREPATVRAQKRKLTGEAQQKANIKYSWQKLKFKLAANFLPGDLVVTLTYDDEHLPTGRTQAQACLNKFRKNMRESRRRRGQEFVAGYATEHLHSSSWIGEDRRWHHHVVMNAAGDDFREILSAWPYGSNVEIHRLELTKIRTYETLARYMAKERADTENSHVWGFTRNARRPESESYTVPDDAEIAVPEGATHVTRTTSRTEFGEWTVVEYLGASVQTLRQLRPKTRRRRR